MRRFVLLESHNVISINISSFVILNNTLGRSLNLCDTFPRYLAKNSSALFSASDYEVAPPEYHRKAV